MQQSLQRHRINRKENAHRQMKNVLAFIAIILGTLCARAETKVYVFPIKENISLSTVRLTGKCLAEARQTGASLIIIDLNTYGGLVDAADSIRQRIADCPIPVYVFINDRAVSAGALIALSADKIYMRPEATIGAATVVNQTGEPMPDKYQSFMRAIMRSTAEAHGKKQVVDNGDTSYVWIRDPKIAEAMVGASLSDSASVLSLTGREAEKAGFNEGTVNSVAQIMEAESIADYDIYRYRLSAVDKIVGFLSNPIFQGLMIMLIVAGIYFELQTPGVGFPLCVALIGAAMYFAPLYIEGVVEYWEVITFMVGVLLIILELFVTPGFGMFGIIGVTAMIFGLVFAIIDRNMLRYIPTGEISASYIAVPLCTVVVSITLSLILSMWTAKRLLTRRSSLKSGIVLESSLSSENGYVSHVKGSELVGRSGIVSADLKPTGRVYVNSQAWQASSEEGIFIAKGEKVRIVRYEGGVAYCRRISE